MQPWHYAIIAAAVKPIVGTQQLGRDAPWRASNHAWVWPWPRSQCYFQPSSHAQEPDTENVVTAFGPARLSANARYRTQPSTPGCASRPRPRQAAPQLSRGTNLTNGIRCPAARKSASDPSTANPINRGRQIPGECAVLNSILREDLGSLVFGNGSGGHGDRAPADLDAGSGCVEDVLVPSRSRAPPGGNDKAVIVRIMPNYFQDRLTRLSGDPSTVIQQHQSITEQPPSAVPVSVNG